MTKRYFAVDKRKFANGQIRLKLGAFRPRLGRDDALLIYERREDDLIFTAYTTVESVQEQEEDAGRFQTASAAQLSAVDGERRLSVLAGSLEKVYRFLDPERHFRRGIVRLSREDYETIIENAIDIDRSIFRYLFTALPLQVQVDFLSSQPLEEHLAKDGIIRDYEGPCKSLLKYFDERVDPFVNLIANFERAFSELGEVKNLPRLEHLQFYSPETRETVEFGTVARTLKDLAHNSLFIEKSGVARLLSEAADQLGSTRKKQSPRRKWNET